MVRLIPRDERFLELFTADGENLVKAARALESMIVEYDRLDERVAEIRILEKAGDGIDAQINDRLENAFITPFDRADIHEDRKSTRLTPVTSLSRMPSSA